MPRIPSRIRPNVEDLDARVVLTVNTVHAMVLPTAHPLVVSTVRFTPSASFEAQKALAAQQARGLVRSVATAASVGSGTRSGLVVVAGAPSTVNASATGRVAGPKAGVPSGTTSEVFTTSRQSVPRVGGVSLEGVSAPFRVVAPTSAVGSRALAGVLIRG